MCYNIYRDPVVVMWLNELFLYIWIYGLSHQQRSVIGRPCRVSAYRMYTNSTQGHCGGYITLDICEGMCISSEIPVSIEVFIGIHISLRMLTLSWVLRCILVIWVTCKLQYFQEVLCHAFQIKVQKVKVVWNCNTIPFIVWGRRKVLWYPCTIVFSFRRAENF